MWTDREVSIIVEDSVLVKELSEIDDDSVDAAVPDVSDWVTVSVVVEGVMQTDPLTWLKHC